MTNRLPLDILIIVKLILDQPVQTLILFFVFVCLFVCLFFSGNSTSTATSTNRRRGKVSPEAIL